MLQTPTAIPSGRRKITLRMLAAQAAVPPPMHDISAGKALSALKRAAPALGIPRRLVDLMDYLIGRTRAVDWQDGPLICWPSNDTLSDALQLGRTQIKTLIRLGQEFGLFWMRDSADGKRYGHRGEGGRILIGYGFDLSPLLARVSELQQIAQAHEERRKEGKRLRKAVIVERNRILSMCDFALDQKITGAWESIIMKAREITLQRASSYDPDFLAHLQTELLSLSDAVTATLSMEQKASDVGSNSVETGPKGPNNWPVNTSTNIPSISKEISKMDGPKRPESNYTKPPAQKGGLEKTGLRERRSALRGFVVTPEFVLQIAPIFQGWMSARQPGWHDLLEAGFYVRSELGISKDAWGQACAMLGRTEAVVALAAIASRTAVGAVKSPGGLLRRMVELHERNELRLDKTLFGLSVNLKETAH